MDNEKYEVDVDELERQRYDNIKKSGEYLELDILIGTEKEEYNGSIGTIPVVSTKMNNCGPTEVACLYATLQEYIKMLEEDYPAECLYSKLTMKSIAMNNITTDLEDEKEEE